MTGMIQEILSTLLFSLGFEQMSKDVRKDSSVEGLRRYARIIIKQLPADKKPAIQAHFQSLNLI